MKTVGYVRVSKDKQAEKIRAMALMQGAELSEIIVESASRPRA
jgi:DNA invertase Pin-like site-specific DNA recombinase